MESGMQKHQEEVVLLQEKKEKAKYNSSNKKVKNSYMYIENSTELHKLFLNN